MRQSNIELCRLAAIFLVLVVHSCFATFGTPQRLDNTAIQLLLGQSLSIVCVNVFVFITGYFGIRFRWSSLASLLFVCLFYAAVRIGVSVCDGRFDWRDCFFLSHSNWFVVEYVGLYLLSPVLNSFVAQVSKPRFALLLAFLVGYLSWTAYFPVLGKGVANGYSAFSFAVIYLAARYHRLYGFPAVLREHAFSIYLGCSVLTFALGLFFLTEHWSVLPLFAYSSPLVMLASLGFFLCFERLSLPPLRWVNHAAKSCLSVLLFHVGTTMFPYLRAQILDFYAHAPAPIFLLQVFGLLIGIFVFVVLIDQLRLALFGLLSRTPVFRAVERRVDTWF